MKKGLIFLGGVALGTLLFLSITFYLYLTNGDPVLTDIVSAHGRLLNDSRVEEITKADLTKIEDLLQKGYIVDTNELIADISSFYTSIIEVLVILIAILGVVSFMFIRVQSEAAASQTAKEAVRVHLESTAFSQSLTKLANENFGTAIESLSSDVEDVSGLTDHINNRLSAIETNLAEQDQDEMEDLDEEISQPQIETE